MNTCKFVPIRKSTDTFTTMNFVCERDESVCKGPFTYSFCRVYLVTEGECTVKFNRQSFTAVKNDVFIIFPAVEYSFECTDKIKLMYVSFLGLRIEDVFSRFGISKSNCHFEKMSHIRSFWEQEFICENEIIDLVSESVVLYTFSEIGKRCIKQWSVDKKTKKSETMLFIKKYIDENFTDPNLSLDSVSDKFKYNNKYLSHHFKSVFGYGMAEYLNLIRINYACTLIEDNHHFVKDIAFKCGYKDPLYFSRVFKKQIGYSPKELIQKKMLIHNE